MKYSLTSTLAVWLIWFLPMNTLHNKLYETNLSYKWRPNRICTRKDNSFSSLLNKLKHISLIASISFNFPFNLLPLNHQHLSIVRNLLLAKYLLVFGRLLAKFTVALIYIHYTKLSDSNESSVNGAVHFEGFHSFNRRGFGG